MSLFNRLFSKYVYQDKRDLRRISDFPYIANVSDAFPNNLDDLLIKCKKQIEETPDGDVAYIWASNCYKKMGKSEEAEEIIKKGLGRSKRKSLLLNKLGELQMEHNRAVEATKSFVASINAQTEMLYDHTPYLYIAEIAIGCLEEQTGRKAEQFALEKGYALKSEAKNSIRHMMNPHRKEIVPILKKIEWPLG